MRYQSAAWRLVTPRVAIRPGASYHRWSRHERRPIERAKMAVAIPNPEIHQLSQEEGFDLLDRQAMDTLGIDGDEFRRRWEAGEYGAEPDRPEIIRLVMLLPLGR
jgi:hypothetical protein